VGANLFPTLPGLSAKPRSDPLPPTVEPRHPPSLKSARTPLFGALRRAAALATASLPDGAPPLDELVEMREARRWSRRRLLQTAAVAAGGALVGLPPVDAVGRIPRIVIVGGGVAGLNAAYTLRKAGVRAIVYEASERTGGRIFTGRDVLAPGLTTELGGEFIDSGHAEMLALARELRLDLVDTHGAGEAALTPEVYFFDGQHRTEAEAAAAFRPFAARIAADRRTLGDTINYRVHTPAAARLDRMSILEYLERAGTSGWLRELLEVAYTTEYGLDADRQSALNLLTLISTDVAPRVELYGDSDERYKIRGGNERLVEALAARLPGQLRPHHRLEALRSRGRGYRLTFATPAGARDVDADFVLLCLPFTMLRQAALRVDLPPVKRRAIEELGYGTNAKVMAGFTQRVWREQGYSGAIYTDTGFQSAWDSSRRQRGAAGGLTFFLGGGAGLGVGKGAPLAHVRRFMEAAETTYPGLTAAFNGTAVRFHWSTHPYTRGSYSCYRPGQWTRIGGAEGAPVGNLFFAGEHTSAEFQGFMNGAAETGKAAANRLLARVRR